MRYGFVVLEPFVGCGAGAAYSKLHFENGRSLTCRYTRLIVAIGIKYACSGRRPMRRSWGKGRMSPAQRRVLACSVTSIPVLILIWVGITRHLDAERARRYETAWEAFEAGDYSKAYTRFDVELKDLFETEREGKRYSPTQLETRSRPEL